MQVFIASGVAPEKVFVVPEGINTTYWDASKHSPMPMPQVRL